MAIKHSTTCMHRRTRNGGLLPLRKRETPARESARAFRIERREDDALWRRLGPDRIYFEATPHPLVTWKRPRKPRGPHLNLNTSGQRRQRRELKAAWREATA